MSKSGISISMIKDNAKELQKLADEFYRKEIKEAADYCNEVNNKIKVIPLIKTDKINKK